MTLERLYARIPSLACKPGCTDCCGPVCMSRVEWKRICDRLGYEPRGDASLNCPMIAGGRCVVYDLRPAICRLYGTVKGKLECPHVKPERWLTDAEARVILREAGRIGV